MGKEIERKYLVNKVAWQAYKANLPNTPHNLGIKYCQGYLATNDETTVRLRIIGNRGYLTIKSKTVGIVRSEFEYSIPVEDAQEMLNTLCLKPLIEKIRHKINHGDLVWEVDEFLGDNAGLIIAEVELENEQQEIDIPDWIDREVNHPKYFNSSLVRYPYSQWENK